MPHILDLQVPTEAPTGAPGGDYQHIQTSPEMFGGYGARALGELGQGVEKAGVTGLDVATEWNLLQGHLHAAELKSNFDQGLTKLHTDYMQTEGRAALEARPKVEQQARELRDQVMAQAGSMRERALLMPGLTSLTDQYQRYWAGHAASQMRTYEKKVASESIGNKAALATNALILGNEPKFKEHLDEQDAEVHNFYDRMEGYEFNDIGIEAQKRRGLTLKTALATIADGGDPGRAQKLFDKYRDLMDPESVRQVTAHLAHGNAEISGRSIADEESGHSAATGALDGEISRAAQKNGIDPALLRTVVRIESSGRPNAVTGSYKGLGQLSDEEFRKHGGTGSIFDPRANLDATAHKLAAETGDFEKQYGRLPTAAEIYLIHQQGAGGFAAHSANPDAPAWRNMFSTAEGRTRGETWAKQAIWGNISDDAKAQFGSVDNITSRQFVQYQNDRVARLSSDRMPLADKGEAYERILARTESNPLVQNAAVARLNQIYTTADARRIDEERLIRFAEHRRKTDSEARVQDYYADSWSGDPKLTARDVDLDPRLTEPDKNVVRKILERPMKTEVNASISAANAKELYRRMFQVGPGDPQHVPDLSVVQAAYASADPRTGISRADYEFLKKEYKESTTPEGSSFVKEKQEFFHAIEPMIDKTLDLSGTGRARMLNFMRAVNKDIDAAKTPKEKRELLELDPDTSLPKHFDVSKYQGSLQQQLTPAAAAAARPPAGGAATAPRPPVDNFEAAKRDLKLTAQEQALYQRHLSNLYGTGGVNNPDGSRSSLFQLSFEEDGKTYNIPSVWNGKILPVDQAIARARQEGLSKFPSYTNNAEAEARYDAMHRYMEKDTAQYMRERNRPAGKAVPPRLPGENSKDYLARTGQAPAAASPAPPPVPISR